MGLKLTRKEAEKILTKIEEYANAKNNNIFDAFYHHDLYVFETLINEATLTLEEEHEMALTLNEKLTVSRRNNPRQSEAMEETDLPF